MTDDERFTQWQVWIKMIFEDVQNHLLQRYILREVWQLIETNPRIQRSSAFYDWMKNVYAASAVMGIRRQVDDHRDCISLRNLLADIRREPAVLSRDRYVALYREEGLRELGAMTFDRYSGEGASHIDQRMVQADLRRLLDVTVDLERFATKRVAHQDPGPPPRVPTFHELDEALDLLEELVKKYVLLLLAQGGAIVPVIVYDWQAIFREPWSP